MELGVFYVPDLRGFCFVGRHVLPESLEIATSGGWPCPHAVREIWVQVLVMHSRGYMILGKYLSPLSFFSAK